MKQLSVKNINLKQKVGQKKNENRFSTNFIEIEIKNVIKQT